MHLTLRHHIYFNPPTLSYNTLMCNIHSMYCLQPLCAKRVSRYWWLYCSSLLGPCVHIQCLIMVHFSVSHTSCLVWNRVSWWWYCIVVLILYRDGDIVSWWWYCILVVISRRGDITSWRTVILVWPLLCIPRTVLVVPNALPSAKRTRTLI
jgi:hypothetical protein